MTLFSDHFGITMTAVFASVGLNTRFGASGFGSYCANVVSLSNRVSAVFVLLAVAYSKIIGYALCKGTAADDDGSLVFQIGSIGAVAGIDFTVDSTARDGQLTAVIHAVQRAAVNGHNTTVPYGRFKRTAIDHGCAVGGAVIIHIVERSVVFIVLSIRSVGAERAVFNRDLAVVSKQDILLTQNRTVTGNGQITCDADIDCTKSIDKVCSNGLAVQIQRDLLTDGQTLGQSYVAIQLDGLPCLCSCNSFCKSRIVVAVNACFA